LKILLLSDANSIHTQRWAESISQHGIEVQLFSLICPSTETKEKYQALDIKITSLNLKSDIKELKSSSIKKINYLKSIPVIKKILKVYEPDIVHAHYASSYGFLGVLSGCKPLITSVWGSDIYFFPYKNKINRYIINYVLTKSDVVCSTSLDMKRLIEIEYSKNDVRLISFGVDTNQFRPKNQKKQSFNVGTIKSIEDHNGIDCLIEAASLVINYYKKNIKFTIVGDGSLKKEMQQKVKKLKIADKVEFVGFVKHENVLKYYNELSVFIAVSTRESFGVSVLEAAACEVPSITSDVGGLPEVNIDNETGFVIKPNEPLKLAKLIIMLNDDDELRFKLGKNARKRVKSKYNWNHDVVRMINVYKKNIK
tara:strand:+ start:1504 stop:2604 length:1101 start_codon:yes stop_codon:yes gene_type:complete